jgi:hypothetical protein
LGNGQPKDETARWGWVFVVDAHLQNGSSLCAVFAAGWRARLFFPSGRLVLEFSGNDHWAVVRA